MCNDIFERKSLFPLRHVIIYLLPHGKLFCLFCATFFFCFLDLAKLFLCLLSTTVFLVTSAQPFPDLHITIFMCTNICLCWSYAYLLGSLHIFFEPILFLLSLGHRHVSHFYVLCYWYSIVLILCMIIFCIFIARLIHVYFLSISSLCLCNTIPVLARCNHESLRVIFSQLLLACTFVLSFLLLAP